MLPIIKLVKCLNSDPERILASKSAGWSAEDKYSNLANPASKCSLNHMKRISMNLRFACDDERPMYAMVIVLVLSWYTVKGLLCPICKNAINSAPHCNRSNISDSPMSSAEVECRDTTFCFKDFHTNGTPPCPSLPMHNKAPE